MQITATPGKVFQSDEKVDNDKLNLLGQPTITIDGGLELEEMEFGAWFVAANDGSTANTYVGKLADERQDVASLVEGLVVVFKIPATLSSTGASTFRLKASDGTVIGTATIKWRGRDIRRNELVAGRYYEFRYNAADTVWQLTGEGLVEPADALPGAYAYGTDSSSSATAWALTFDPAPTSLAQGLIVRCVAPVANTGALTLQVKDGAGNNVGGAVAVQKVDSGGIMAALAGGEIRAGVPIELMYVTTSGGRWLLLTEPGPVIGSGSVGLVVKNNGGAPNTVMDISADELVVRNSRGDGRVLTSVSVSANIATSGANGLDTGAAANDTWYYLWVIWNAGTTAALLSTSSTSPTMPAGYTHKALVGAVRRNGSSAFVSTLIVGRECYQAPAVIFTAKAAVGGATYEALGGADLTAFQAAVPPIAKGATGVLGSSDGAATGGCAMAVAADASGLGETMVNIPANGYSFNGSYAAGPFRVPLKTAQQVYWMNYDTEVQARLVVNGWWF